MKSILIIGASGFVGGRLARTMREEGLPVRCLVRTPDRVKPLADLGCEIVCGDLSDPVSLRQAMDSVRAVYLSVHTLSPQPGSDKGRGFMEVERTGVENVLTACREAGVPRILSVTSLGIGPDQRSEWLRERWHIEQMLLDSALDATVIRPGCIVGRGGRGFENILKQAQSRVAIVMGGKRASMRTIAVDDLVYYLRAALDEAQTFGRRFDVGNDDVLAPAELIDETAAILGKPRPLKIPFPLGALTLFAPVIEKMAKIPHGAVRGFVQGIQTSYTSDPGPIREILPRPLLSYRQAVGVALEESHV